jgi:CTP synthase (UTP-ammonia lyase)
MSSNKRSAFMIWSIGPPTQGRVYQELLQNERSGGLGGKPVVNHVQMMNIALYIECQQFVNI